MADVIYMQVLHDLKERIYSNEFPDKKLPDERSLAESYGVSRSSIKRALNILAGQGIIFKKRGSGTFVNPLYLKNQPIFHNEGSNLGVTDSYRIDGRAPSIELLNFQVIPADEDLQQALFLSPGDFVYQLQRLRRLDGEPFMIENGFIPIKVLPELGMENVTNSIFNFVEDTKKKAVTKSFMSVMAEPSTERDRRLLGLSATEPVGVMEGIFFLDDGTPFEVSTMRLHYKYMKYNAFVSLDSE
ncbi:GntR family transcriptional regulator [Periweissella fabaria]|uniref:Mannosyl-D-glycerate transport/metabolism system repressor MngR n=1 Tax=Periweissella fabaria TaxID=546157 RepID=A0ABN8BJH6_9LACO|nr:GntR family transcriptional regulator [Periweissella fabaria]MCM0597653.1 GntR family transcriptional regulator [Periweissella fabaria]CAH0416838.1 Mannosyl-D-glycerate transport/metabolism system repressor MngR [Periweissella fabaria]